MISYRQPETRQNSPPQEFRLLEALHSSEGMGALLRPLCGLTATALFGAAIVTAALCGTAGENTPQFAAALLAPRRGTIGPAGGRQARLRPRRRPNKNDITFQLQDGSNAGSPFTYMRLGLDVMVRQTQQASEAAVDRSPDPVPPAGVLTPVDWLRPSDDFFQRTPSTTPADPGSDPRRRSVPINVTTRVKSQTLLPRRRQLIAVESGDTLQSILAAMGMPAATIVRVVAAFAGTQAGDPTVRPGDLVIITGGRLKGLDAPAYVALRRPGVQALEVARTDRGRYWPVYPHAPLDRALLTEALSLNGAELPIQSADLSQALAALEHGHLLTDADCHEVTKLATRDFGTARSLTAADSVTLLFDGPQISELTLSIGGKNRSYYWFAASTADAGRFYDKAGYAAAVAFIRKPVAGRMGDGFAWRTHPILHKRLFHEGVDFAAPFGSPIKAAAPGVVERIGWEAGYGNYVRVRHADGYATVYAHIAGPVAGLKIGQRVRRGEVIARVGSTGLSTGPHLYFELWAHGKRVDPMHAPIRIVPALSGADLDSFEQTRARLDDVEEAAALLYPRGAHS